MALPAPAPPAPDPAFPELAGARPLSPAEYAHAQALVASAIAPAQPWEAKHSEREVELSEFEQRVRTFTLDLVRPTILKVRMLEHEMGDLRSGIAANAATLRDLSMMSARVEQQIAIVEGFREDLTRWDNERRKFEAESGQALVEMQQEVGRLATQVDQQDFAITAVQRSVERMGEELSKAHQDNVELTQQMDTRFTQQTKVFNAKTSDLEVKLIALEARHDKLQDDLFGEGKGLFKLTHDLKLTDNLAHESSREIGVLKQDRATVLQVEGLQEEMNNRFGDTSEKIAELMEKLAGESTELKAYCRSTANTVSAHTAAMIHEVRVSYRAELHETAKSRTDFMKFMEEVQANIERLEGSLGAFQGEAEEARKRLAEDFEALERLQRKDRCAAELEMRAVRERVDGVLGSSGEVSGCLEHIGGVLWMILQSERAASALDIQDDQDRSKVALMGYRDHSLSGPGASPAPPLAPRPRSSTPGSAPSRPRSRAAGAADPSVSGQVLGLDNRCMSCTGQSQAVQTAFKMACIQYAPGPVNFAQKVYNRGDLLDLRNKLLHRACDVLQHGPVPFKPVEVIEPSDASVPQPPTPVTPAGTSPEMPVVGQLLSDSRSSSPCMSLPSLPPMSARQSSRSSSRATNVMVDSHRSARC